MKDLFRIDGKVCIVTGAGRGIGATCAEVLAKAGGKVMVTDVLEEEGKTVTSGIINAGGEAAFERLDVTQEDNWIDVIDKTIKRFGGLDVMVNNAGMEGNNLVENISLAQWRQVMAVNADGVLLGTKHAILAMKPGGAAGKGGSIVNMCSMCGMIAIANTATYSATKGAVRLLTKVAAIECGQLKYGIRVNSVHPGVIHTPLLLKGTAQQVELGLLPSVEEGIAMYESMHPIGRLGETKDVANAVLYLASDASGFMTGSEFVVDGGYTAQ
jgi:3alpha(or 20beta)-hydroxysteroid dehydrogenase